MRYQHSHWLDNHLLPRTLCVALLLFSQYAVALHAAEHPFHQSEHACEIFQGVQSLDHATLDGGIQHTLWLPYDYAIPIHGSRCAVTAPGSTLIRDPPPSDMV